MSNHRLSNTADGSSLSSIFESIPQVRRRTPSPRMTRTPVTLPSQNGNRSVMIPMDDDNSAIIPIVVASSDYDESPCAAHISPASQPVSSLQKMLSQDSVEQLLAKKGYTVTAKILVQGSEGAEARYFEAINKMGHKILIELDTDGFVAIGPDDLTLQEGKIATVIPYSTKNGILESSANEVLGIAFICADGICTLVKDEGPNPTETTFVYSNSSQGKIGKLGDQITPYPIVRLSEIGQDNEGTIDYTIKKVTEKMRDDDYKACRAQFHQTKEEISNLARAFDGYERAIMEADARLKSAIHELEDINARYIRNPPTDEVNRENYRQVVYNLRRRHEMAVDLMYLCSIVAHKRAKINRLTEHIKEVTKEIQDEFSTVGYVLKE